MKMLNVIDYYMFVFPVLQIEYNYIRYNPGLIKKILSKTIPRNQLVVRERPHTKQATLQYLRKRKNINRWIFDIQPTGITEDIHYSIDIIINTEKLSVKGKTFIETNFNDSYVGLSPFKIEKVDNYIMILNIKGILI